MFVPRDLPAQACGRRFSCDNSTKNHNLTQQSACSLGWARLGIHQYWEIVELPPHQQHQTHQEKPLFLFWKISAGMQKQAVFFLTNPWTLFTENSQSHRKSTGIWAKLSNYLINRARARLPLVRAHLCTDRHENSNLSSQDSNWLLHKISWRFDLLLRILHIFEILASKFLKNWIFSKSC